MDGLLQRIREIINDAIRAVVARILIALNARVICQHFCAFKEAGSNFRYVHVHLLVAGKYPGNSNPDGYSGLGHDDETPGLSNPSDPMHNSVSRGDRIEFRPSPKPDKALAPIDLKALNVHTAYIHPAPEDITVACPPGFFRMTCDCGDVCVSFDHDAWEEWHKQF